MPRMKKKQIIDATMLQVMRIYKTALYIRLSYEDMRKKSAETVLTQKAMLEGFVQNSPDLEVYNVYEDINFTGTNFSRPGFMRMLEDIISGLVDCVVVKDLKMILGSYFFPLMVKKIPLMVAGIPPYGSQRVSR